MPCDYFREGKPIGEKKVTFLFFSSLSGLVRLLLLSGDYSRFYFQMLVVLAFPRVMNGSHGEV